MSRSGYSDDCGGWELIMYRGAVTSAIKGARGQKLLRDLAAALDAMPAKRLIAEDFVSGTEVCALGALGLARGMDMSGLDPEEPEAVARAFGIAPSLAREIMYENDEEWAYWKQTTPEQRWLRMRKWVSEQIQEKP